MAESSSKVLCTCGCGKNVSYSTRLSHLRGQTRPEIGAMVLDTIRELHDGNLEGARMLLNKCSHSESSRDIVRQKRRRLLLPDTTSTSVASTPAASTSTASNSAASASTTSTNQAQAELNALKAIIAEQQAKLDKIAKAEAARPPEGGLIVKPPVIRNLQTAMQLQGQKKLYNSCRSAVKTACVQTGILPEVHWYHQDIDLLGRAAARAKEVQPRLALYARNWATFEIIKSNHKNKRSYQTRGGHGEQNTDEHDEQNIDESSNLAVSARLTEDDAKICEETGNAHRDKNATGDGGNQATGDGGNQATGDGGNVATAEDGNSGGQRCKKYGNRRSKRQRTN